MLESCPDVRMVMTTAATRDEGERLGKTLVDERLAACATVLPGATSIYRWEGALETASEALLLLKTEVGKLPALEARLIALHSYTTPEVLVFPLEAGSAAYLEWMRLNVRG